MGIDKKIGVCHLISGDLWAGAEVQMFTLMIALRSFPEFELSAIVLNEGILVEKLHKIGINVVVFDESRMKFMEIYRGVRAFLELTRPTILHSHRYKENILGALVKRGGCVKFLVQTVHGIGEPFRGVREVKSQLYSLANIYFTRKRFDKVIAVSDDIHRRLDRYLVPDKVVTIHNAINLDTISPVRCAELVRAEFGIGKDTPVIGSIGRMAPIKGFDLFLEMAKRIVSNRADVRFLLVGDGPMRGRLENQANKLGLAESVIFTGFRSDVTDLINCLDIFAMTSYHEGIPTALLEAMAMGKAVVSTAVGGISEIIEDGISGVLVKPGDTRQLAATCLRLLDDQNIRYSLAAAARVRVEEEFSIITLGERVSHLYKGILINQ